MALIEKILEILAILGEFIIIGLHLDRIVFEDDVLFGAVDLEQFCADGIRQLYSGNWTVNQRCHGAVHGGEAHHGIAGGACQQEDDEPKG